MERPRACLLARAGRFGAVNVDGEVQVAQETGCFVLAYQDIAKRDVAVQRVVLFVKRLVACFC
jgi:hypothetical protein